MTNAFKYTDSAFVPIGEHSEYSEGQVYFLEESKSRSMQSHRHEFAWLRTAWLNIPEHLKHMPWAKSPEHMRKHGLINCDPQGRFVEQKLYPCETPGEAERWAAHLNPMDEYSFVCVRENSVLVLTAKSQSVKAMGRKDFQDSKTMLMEYVADLIGVNIKELEAV